MLLSNLLKKPKQPNYFLYTSTYSKDFRDFGLYDNIEYKNAAHTALNALYNAYKADKNSTYSKTKFGKFTVHCFLLKDKRKDRLGRRIYSLFGVIVDNKDKSFNAETFISKVNSATFKITYNVFDFAKEFPLQWREGLEEVPFHQV